MAILKYDKLSDELQERIQDDIKNNKRPDFACRNDLATRRIQIKILAMSGVLHIPGILTK